MTKTNFGAESKRLKLEMREPTLKGPNMQKINMNARVYVQLTDHAKKILEENLAESSLPENIEKLARSGWQPDTQGWTKFTLWELGQEFGKHMYNGSKQLFVDNVIRIPDSEMCDV